MVKLQEPISGKKQFRNLDVEDLRISKLADRHIYSIHVDITNKLNNDYTIIHNFNLNPNEPSHIIITSYEKDKKDFKNVAEIIAKEVSGEPQEMNMKMGSGFLDIITLDDKFTQSKVADLIDKYKKCFEDVKIRLLDFNRMYATTPRSKYSQV